MIQINNIPQYKVFSIFIENPNQLNLGTLTVDGDIYNFLHDTSINYVSIVNVSTDVPIMQPPLVPAAQYGALLWQQKSFTWTSIIANYPDAKLIDAFIPDGGLPKNTFIPSMTLNLADSGNTMLNVVKVNFIKFNGVKI